MCQKSENPEDDQFAVRAAQKPKIPIDEDSIQLKPFDSKDPVSPDTEDIMPTRENDNPEKNLLTKKTKPSSLFKNKGRGPTEKELGQKPADDVEDVGEKVENDSKNIKHPKKKGMTEFEDHF